MIKPGDLIFYPDDGVWKHRIFSWMQKVGKEMGDVTDISLTHVAMVSSESDLIIEMKWPRPRFRFFASDTREKIVMRPRCEDAIKLRAIYWCYFHIDLHYSFLSMVKGEFGIKDCYKVCSGWINKGYKDSGFSFIDGEHKLVSPNELFSSKKLDRVT